MADYYKSNAIYDELSKITNNFIWVSGNSWLLVYGNREDLTAKVIVIAHGTSWNIEKDVLETINNIGAKINIPVYRVVFDDSPDSLIETVDFYKTLNSELEKCSLTDLKNHLQDTGLNIVSGKCDKYLNDKTSSAYHKWQRSTLGNRIIVSDLDLIRVDSDNNPLEIIELKRSTMGLNLWNPYAEDYINFNLVESLSKKLKIPLNIIYNKMEKDKETKIVSKDIADKISIFSYEKNSPKREKVNYDFKDFVNGNYLKFIPKNDIINKNNTGIHMRFWTGENIKELKENQVFVFGSNPQGRHGAGAAKAAMEFGAKYGIGRGLQGQTYALITKNLEAGFVEKATGITYAKEGYGSVSKDQISKNIDELYECANQNADKLFVVVYKNETWPNGSPKKSLNGYTGEEIFKLFAENKTVPANIIMHDSFKPLYKNLLGNAANTPVQENKPVNDGKYTYFWKSQSTFSQWHPSKFVYKNITFSSAEQFMMYSKAKLFGSADVAKKIMDYNNTPLIAKFLNGTITNKDICNDKEMLKEWDKYQKAIKDLGREVKNYVEDVWKVKRVPIVSVASREKYDQNPEYKKELMQHAGTKMVEASPYDKIWGIGLDQYKAAKIPEDKWPGLNLLGNVLTDLCNNYTNELKNRNKMKP